ncbi:MAG TPA: Cof-type HAD-IIB family hydrolase, partial [Allocoleopsis sp.]
KDIRLVVLDIDGTIAGESNQVRDSVKQVIKSVQAKGINVAIATGRMYKSALRFHQDVGSDMPLIAYQGAWIQAPMTQIIHRHLPVSENIALKLLNYFEQNHLRHLLSVHFYVNDQLYVRELTPDSIAYGKRTQVDPIPVGDLRDILVKSAPTKILAISEDTQLIDNLLQDVRGLFSLDELYVTKSVPIFFEATNPLVNKGTAVKFLAEEILGLTANNVMTIGDNFNDIEMLEYAGLGVAMGNAPDMVKSYSNYVTANVNEDGAAIAMSYFLL